MFLSLIVGGKIIINHARLSTVNPSGVNLCFSDPDTI